MRIIPRSLHLYLFYFIYICVCVVGSLMFAAPSKSMAHHHLYETMHYGSNVKHALNSLRIILGNWF